MEYVVIEPDAVSDPGLRADLLDTWVAATDAGGSVGFTAPAPVQLVAETLDLALERVAAGKDLLGVLHNGERYVGMGLLVGRDSALNIHWRTVLRVMVHPKYQGGGAGRLLMDGLRGSAVEPRAAATAAHHPRREQPGGVLRQARLPGCRPASPRSTGRR